MKRQLVILTVLLFLSIIIINVHVYSTNENLIPVTMKTVLYSNFKESFIVLNDNEVYWVMGATIYGDKLVVIKAIHIVFFDNNNTIVFTNNFTRKELDEMFSEFGVNGVNLLFLSPVWPPSFTRKLLNLDIVVIKYLVDGKTHVDTLNLTEAKEKGVKIVESTYKTMFGDEFPCINISSGDLYIVHRLSDGALIERKISEKPDKYMGETSKQVYLYVGNPELRPVFGTMKTTTATSTTSVSQSSTPPPITTTPSTTSTITQHTTTTTNPQPQPTTQSAAQTTTRTTNTGGQGQTTTYIIVGGAIVAIVVAALAIALKKH